MRTADIVVVGDVASAEAAAAEAIAARDVAITQAGNASASAAIGATARDQAVAAAAEAEAYASSVGSTIDLRMATAATPDNDTQKLSSPADVIRRGARSLLTDMLPFPGYISRSVLEKLGDWVNVKDFGAVLDGVTDDTAAFNAALATGQIVEMPIGTARITDALVLRHAQVLIGKDRTLSIIKIDGDFNMAALGAVRFQAGETGSSVQRIGFMAAQPATPASRTDIIKYPPAIYAQGCPRFRIQGVRISKFDFGIDARLNCGGACIDDLEIGCYSNDVWFDGSLDSVRLTRLHHWPFDGMTVTAHRAIYSDSEHYGLRIGRVDDLHIAQWIGFSIPKAMYFYAGTVPGAEGAAFGHVVGADFDDRGGLVIAGSGPRITFTGCIFTMGKTDAQFINQAGGWALFTNCRFEGPPVASPLNMIELSGGASMYSNCNFNCSAQDLPLFKRTGAGNLDVVLSGCVIAMSAVLTQAFTTPILDLGDAKGILSGVHILGAKGAGGVRDLLNSTRNDTGLTLGPINLNGWGFGTASQASKQISTIGASVITSGGTIVGTSESALTAPNAGRGVFRFATGTGNQTDESLIFGIEDTSNAWMQVIKPGTGFRNLWLQPVGGSVGVGSVKTPVSAEVGTTTVAVAGRTTHGRVELSTVAADANGVAVGDILFSDKNSSLGEKRRVIVRGALKGTTANARGGKLQVLTAGDNSSTLTAVLDLSSDAVIFGSAATTMGFYGAAGTAKPTITGSRGGNAAVTDLLTKLAALGLITDSTSA